MKKSVLLIGAGRFGRYTAMKIHELGHEIMVIDKDEERINKILPYVTDAQIGDSTNNALMSSLGVRNYDLCIIAIGDDFLSALETTFLLHGLGAQKIIARATTGSQEKFLLHSGASAVVFPERELGAWTAIRYCTDNISNYIELTDGWSILEVAIPKEWDGKKVGELHVRRMYSINILGVRNSHMNMDISNDTVLHYGQTMLVLGRYERIRRVFSL